MRAVCVNSGMDEAVFECSDWCIVMELEGAMDDRFAILVFQRAGVFEEVCG